jgi:hypothetical protein
MGYSVYITFSAKELIDSRPIISLVGVRVKIVVVL